MAHPNKAAANVERLETRKSLPPALAPSLDSRDVDAGGFRLGDIIGTILNNRAWVLGMGLAGMVLGFAYAFFGTPIYQTDALIQIEEKKAGLSGLDELSSMFSEAQPAETEMEIMRSRTLVGSVVDALELNVTAKPRFFPLIGSGIARRRGGDGLASPLLGFSSYAWGGEKVEVANVDVGSPNQTVTYTLIAENDGAYRVLDDDGGAVLSGKVGTPATTATTGPDKVQLTVKQLVARPGTEFRITVVPRQDAVRSLQGQLVLKERGRKTGIVELALEGEDRVGISRTLAGISEAYSKQNVDRKSEEASKTLEFLGSQLPLVKADLDKAEEALNKFRSTSHTLDLSAEGKAVLDRTVEIETQLTELQMQRAALRQRFTDSHPSVVGVNQQIGQISAKRNSITTEFNGLPGKELELVRRTRDAKVANELYTLLLNKMQELRVVKSGTIGNVRVLDSAETVRRPIRPLVSSTMLGSLLLGLFAGVGVAFLKKHLHRGEEDPDRIQEHTGIAVFASIPHSDIQETILKTRKRSKTSVLALCDPSDLAIESLRSLRTSLQFALADSRNNVICIGGPSPNIGKSFVAVNLAHVLADTGRSIVLVDGDMRKGRLHEYFSLSREGGFSEVLAGTLPIEQALRKTEAPNLTFIPTGSIPPNPSELLMSGHFDKALDTLCSQFDLVVLDAPPILAVTDGALLAAKAGVNLLVLRAERHPMREITLTVKRFHQSGVEPNGIVINDVPRRVGGYAYYGYYNYQYGYRSNDSGPGSDGSKAA